MTYEEFINNEMLKSEKGKPLPKYPIVIEAMKVFLLFAGAANIVSYAAYYNGGYDAVLYTLPLYVQPWIATFVRRRWKMVVLDVIVFVIFAAWLLFSPALTVMLLSGAYMLGVTGYQIVREFSENEEREASVLVVTFNAVILVSIGIFAIVQGLRGFEWWLGGLALLFAVLFARYQHYIAVEGALEHLNSAVQHSHFSIGRVRRINNRIVWNFILIMLTAIGLAYAVGLDNVVEYAASEVIESIGRDGSKGYSLGAPGTSTVMSDLPEDERPQYDGSTQEDNMLSRMLGHVMRGIIVCWCAIAVISLMIYLIREDRMRQRDEGKTTDLDYEETHEFYWGVGHNGLRQRLVSMLDRSPKNLVRRAYYRRVKGEMGKAVQRSDTPMQVSAKLSNMELLVQQYNEVRYKEEK